MEDNDYYPPIPRYIDREKMLGSFEISEVIVGLIGFFIIFFAGFVLSIGTVIVMPLGLVVTIAIAISVRKIKKKFPDGFLIHYFYRKGYWKPERSDGIKVLPTGYIKYFIH